MTTGTITDHLAGFEAFVDARKGAEPEALLALRRRAFEHASTLGLPDTRHEDWKWTSLKPLTDLALSSTNGSARAVTEASLTELAFDGLDAMRVVLVDGRLAPELSSGAASGIEVLSIADAMNGDLSALLGSGTPIDSRFFAAMNTAFMGDGAVLHIADRAAADRPVHVLSLTTSDAITHPRLLVVAGAGSRASIVETHGAVGATAYATTPVTEIVCGEGAELSHLRVQRHPERAVHLGTLAVRQAGDSRFSSTAIDLGAKLARNELHLTFEGENGYCDVGSLYAGKGTQVIDNHTRLHHAKPHCESHQLFKGILDEKSRGIFDGKIHVYVDAQKTDAKQTARNLLLSDDAISNNKPQLEIYADDVKCTHGATTGQIDDDQLFYLRARGLDTDTARSLLTYAFGREVIERIDLEPVKLRIDREVLSRLPMGELVGDAL